MPDSNQPGGKVVPSAGAAVQAATRDDRDGLIAYVLAVLAISIAIVLAGIFASS